MQYVWTFCLWFMCVCLSFWPIHHRQTSVSNCESMQWIPSNKAFLFFNFFFFSFSLFLSRLETHLGDVKKKKHKSKRNKHKNNNFIAQHWKMRDKKTAPEKIWVWTGTGEVRVISGFRTWIFVPLEHMSVTVSRMANKMDTMQILLLLLLH